MKREKQLIIVCILVGGIIGIYLFFFNTNIEQFDIDLGLPNTNHTVDLPINTTFECENKCGPQSTCSKTRWQQCTSDIDCCGCNTNAKNIQNAITELNQSVEGFTANQLSSAYGNDATNKVDFDIFPGEKSLFKPPPQYFLGHDMWTSSFYEGAKLFNEKNDPNIQKARYNPNPLEFQLKYPNRATLSGQFIENGPLEYNFG